MNIVTARGRSVALALFALGLGSFGSSADARQSDAQIKKAIIKESIDNYSGRCPCPYNTKSNGNSCGGSSAYSRPGGESPKCYPGDVSKAEVEAYRRR
jgi:hypothetical protein